MKKILLFIILVVFIGKTQAQITAGNLLGAPTVTYLSEITAIVSSQIGAVVCNLDDEVYHFTSTSWQTNETSSYVGSFITNNSGNISVPNVPFRPSPITSTANTNVESFELDNDNQSTNNDRGIRNSFEHMNDFARLETDGTTITQNVIYNGSHGNSINDLSRFSSNPLGIGVRYGNQNGYFSGSITANLTSFYNNDFTINVTYTNGSVADISPAEIAVDVLLRI